MDEEGGMCCIFKRPCVHHHHRNQIKLCGYSGNENTIEFHYHLKNKSLFSVVEIQFRCTYVKNYNQFFKNHHHRMELKKEEKLIK